MLFWHPHPHAVSLATPLNSRRVWGCGPVSITCVLDTAATGDIHLPAMLWYVVDLNQGTVLQYKKKTWSTGCHERRLAPPDDIIFLVMIVSYSLYADINGIKDMWHPELAAL